MQLTARLMTGRRHGFERMFELARVSGIMLHNGSACPRGNDGVIRRWVFKSVIIDVEKILRNTTDCSYERMKVVSHIDPRLFELCLEIADVDCVAITECRSYCQRGVAMRLRMSGH